MMTPEKPLSAVTVQELEQMIETLYDLQLEQTEAESVLDRINEHLNNQKLKVLAILNEFNKTSYRTGRGTVIRQRKFQVNNPKDDASKQKFFDYLKERKVFENLVSVNHQTLNAFYKAELEAAKQRGDADLEIPGLAPPTFVDIIQLRKK